MAIKKALRKKRFFVYASGMKNRSGNDIFSAIIEAPFGSVGIRTEAGQLRELVYLPSHFEEKTPSDALSEEAAQQITQYFKQPDFRFDLPLAKVGTAFQQKVWNVISSIPRGEVLTYGQVAHMIGSAPRAVGQACGANWFPLVIPCHRVTATGGLGGFSNQADGSGFHIGVKRWLLAHEGLDSMKGW
jgi:methylated-DNA-[protein]-cysteine S-methyltransferase